MEVYKAKGVGHDVFSANMTIDTRSDSYIGSNLSACKSCQCNCRLCLGGMAPEGVEDSCGAEGILKKLLAA